MMRALVIALCLLAAPALAQNGALAPSSNAVIGIAPAITLAGTSLIIKASPDNLYAVYATNLTATAGFLIVVNATSVPATGSLTGATVLDCIPLQASSVASINYGPSPVEPYPLGIVALVSSGASCTTYTTGTITAFIHGSAP